MNTENENMKKVKEFFEKNGKYVIMGIMAIIIIAGMVMLISENKSKQEDPKVRTEKVLSEEYKVDENEVITKLMKSYYKSYASGDVDALKKIATPISDLEQSYIKMFSKRVEGYNNIKCYIKEGLDKKSYIVSVTMNMKFPDIETQVPSLETFYVRTDDEGNLYIDNLYSTFNYIATQEKEVDETVAEFIDNYEKQDDFVKLAESIEKKSEKAIKSDESLAKYIDKLNNKVIPKWLNNYKAEQEEAQKQAEEEKKKAEEEEKKAEEEKQKAEEEQKKKEEEQKKAAEEKKKAEEEQKKAEEQPAAETVYATTKVNVRDAADTAGNVVATVEFGTAMNRTGTEGDWSIVEYNGATGYVKSEFLSTEVPQEDTSVAPLGEGTTITLKGTTNIRESMSETSTKVAIGYAGDKVTVVMSYAEGWTKVNYKDTIGYIKTELLQ